MIYTNEDFITRTAGALASAGIEVSHNILDHMKYLKGNNLVIATEKGTWVDLYSRNKPEFDFAIISEKYVLTVKHVCDRYMEKLSYGRSVSLADYICLYKSDGNEILIKDRFDDKKLLYSLLQ